MSRTALLALDLQVNHLGRLPADYPARAGAALHTARAAGVPVIHVALCLRAGHLDVHPRNAMFGSLPAGAYTVDDPGAAIAAELGPRGEEIVLDKNRVSAFRGNQLSQILPARGITDLVLVGVATSGVVLSTALEAADADYRVAVLSDACADPDPALHDTLVTRVFARRGDVLTVADWAAALGAPAPTDRPEHPDRHRPGTG